MGCGGILGVNLGSIDEPRLIKVSYRPESPSGHLGLVGKGVMYDSGGISLKPSDESHAQMKNDMTGAAAILGAMTALQDLGCTAAVTAYLCCTDNMPSGSAMKLGDVLRMRNGKTVEVLNTDAEGRLVMADGLCLAVEDGVDAVVDVATLTGACLRTFGVDIAGVMGNHEQLVRQLERAGAVADEPLWELPLHRPYRTQLDSAIADLTNMGGVNAGSITAALFLEEFVDDTPWAHVDIASTAQQPAVRGWRNKGASGFGAKLLIELATRFEAPQGRRAMSAVAAEDAGTGSGGFLGWVERVGNKVPHPAIIFLGLIVSVIVFSAVLSWFDVSVTSEVAEPVPTTVTQEYDGGTTYPSLDHAPGGAGPRLRDRHRDDRGQEPAQRRRDPLHLHDGGPELQRLRRRRGDPDGDDRRRRRRGGGPDRRADPEDGPGRTGRGDHLHHRAARRDLQRRVRRGLPGADPARRGRVRQPGRNPLAGIAAAYAGVSAAFFVNILITPADGIITEVTNEIMARRRAQRRTAQRDEQLLLRDRLDPLPARS